MVSCLKHLSSFSPLQFWKGSEHAGFGINSVDRRCSVQAGSAGLTLPFFFLSFFPPLEWFRFAFACSFCFIFPGGVDGKRCFFSFFYLDFDLLRSYVDRFVFPFFFPFAIFDSHAFGFVCYSKTEKLDFVLSDWFFHSSKLAFSRYPHLDLFSLSIYSLLSTYPGLTVTIPFLRTPQIDYTIRL